MNYFNRRHNRKINPQFLLDVHLESVSYIYEKANDTDLPVVVLTHHAPSFKSIDPIHVSGGIYGTDDLNGAYASDLSSVILDSPNIKFFVHGHTHHNVDYMIGQCRILSNQRGYSFEQSARFFEGTKHFYI
jgi:predicted TIM-barrel fold metal-dependent hydrolase